MTPEQFISLWKDNVLTALFDETVDLQVVQIDLCLF